MLSGATVTLNGPHEALVTQSGGNGNYAFPGVPAGAYSVTPALSGFSDATLEGIVVADGRVEAPPITDFFALAHPPTRSADISKTGVGLIVPVCSLHSRRNPREASEKER